MVLYNIQKTAGKRKKRKSLFPFSGLLRSAEYQGKGAALAQNVVLENGQMLKMKNPEVLFDHGEIDGVEWLGGFKNSDKQYLLLYLIASGDSYVMEIYNLETGVVTYPVLAEANEISITGSLTFTNGSDLVVATGGAFTTGLSIGDYIYLDGEYSSKLRIKTITDNDNLVLESNYLGTGGIGDGKLITKHFGTTELHFRQLGDEAYLYTNEGTDNGYSFDGETFSSVGSVPSYARYNLIDGNRTACNEKFSGEISATMTDFTAGTGVQKSGAYATGGKYNGGIETSAGIILMSDLGGQLHKIIPNAASNDVSAETKLDSFNYTGQGIKNTNQICMGKDFAYIVNSKGIIEINPYSGVSSILTKKGNIERRWANYDVSDAIITYDSKNNNIIALVKDLGQYDTMIVVDLDDEERAISTQPNSYLKSFVNINNQLYGSSSIDGKVFKMFETFSDRDGQPSTFRWILEWDALEGISTENIINEARIFGNLNARSTMTVKLYKNGAHEEVKSETFTGQSSQGSQAVSVIGVMGKYIMGLGERGVAESGTTDIIKKFKKHSRVVTYTLEITETSVYDFRIYDIIMEYKSLSRLTREQTLSNALF